MPRINLLGVGTSGVDLRSNPLSLGNRKVRFATNLQFHEGVVLTRPGLIGRTLGRSGTLQGHCRYAPGTGLSSQTFGPKYSGIAFVMDGDLFFNDGFNTKSLTTDKPYCNLGPVSLYQAENWLIAQNPAGTTIMWDGISEPIRSKGMNEVHWNDPETPWEEALPVRPVAEIPDCDPAPQPWWVKFMVLDAVTLLPIPSAVWSIRRLSAVVFNGVTPTDGTFTIAPAEREYFYSITAKGYYPVNDTRTTFRRPRNAEDRDDCYTVAAADRQLTRIILMTPLPDGWTPGTPPPVDPEEGGCSYDISITGRLYPCDDGVSHEAYVLNVLVSNNSASGLVLNGVSLLFSPVPLHTFTAGVTDPVNGTQPLPAVVPPGESVGLDILAVPSIIAASGVCGLKFVLSTSCGESTEITW